MLLGKNEKLVEKFFTSDALHLLNLLAQYTRLQEDIHHKEHLTLRK